MEDMMRGRIDGVHKGGLLRSPPERLRRSKNGIQPEGSVVDQIHDFT